MGKADVGGKRVLGTAPETWVRWLLGEPDLEVQATLTEEFRFVLRHSDELLHVRGKQGNFLVLTELQLHRDPKMPLRMRAYTGLAEQKYGLPVYPTVLFLLPPEGGKGSVGCYHSEFMGLVSHQDYRVVRAWEIEAREVLDREILALVPYVPLMAGADERAIRDGIKLLRSQKAGEEMEVVLALFASFVMETERIQEIVRWNMAVLRDSPWYQEILQEGREEGLQEGLREGLREGRREEARRGILRLLRVRFDITTEMVEELDRKLKTVDRLPVLHDLSTAAVQMTSLEDFHSLLTEVIESDDGSLSRPADSA